LLAFGCAVTIGIKGLPVMVASAMLELNPPGLRELLRAVPGALTWAQLPGGPMQTGSR